MEHNVHSRLWPFALWLYQQPQVDNSCLTLQDTLGADVNLLLYCVWHGLTRGPIEKIQWHPLHTCSQYWQTQILQPLRTARRNLKPQPELYDLAKKVELACEQAELEALEKLTEKPPASTNQHFSEHNLTTYIGCLQEQHTAPTLAAKEISRLCQLLLSPLQQPT